MNRAYSYHVLVGRLVKGHLLARHTGLNPIGSVLGGQEDGYGHGNDADHSSLDGVSGPAEPGVGVLAENVEALDGGVGLENASVSSHGGKKEQGLC